MRTDLLLAMIATVTYCNTTDFGHTMKDFSHNREEDQSKSRFGVSISSRNFSGLTETLTTGLKNLQSYREEENTINQNEKEMAAILKDYHPNSNKSILGTNSGEDIGRILMQSDAVLKNVQADQIISNDVSDTRSKRQVLKDYGNKNRTWQNGVFYSFNTSETADEIVRKFFTMGVKVWSEATCVDFKEDKSAQDKIVVVKEVGCWSDNGKLGGDQFLSLGEGCEAEGLAAHEIGHALGLLHTMTRFDRDNYIRIVKQNINLSSIGEFTKVNQKYVEVYGLTYDYGSIMHYSELAYSTNNWATMIATNPLYQKTMGSFIISFSDLFVINERYGCNAICNKSTSAKCLNEGFPHPRNCSICICPGGYGGALCDRRPQRCGEDLEATSRKRTLAYRLGFGAELRDQFNYCNYVITAPEGKRIEVDMKSVSVGYDLPGCIYGGVEIKAQKDQKLTGYRFCSVNGSGGPIVSSSNRLSVILFNRLGVMQATFTYRSVD